MPELQRRVPNLNSAWTRKRWANTIQRPFNAAEKVAKIGRNRFRGVRFPQGENGRDLTWEEFRGLLRMSTVPFRQLLCLCVLSGMRPGEAALASKADLRLDADAILLRKHKTLKSTHKPRRIQLIPQTVKLLVWILRQHERREEVAHFLETHGPATSAEIAAACSAARPDLNFCLGRVADLTRHIWFRRRKGLVRLAEAWRDTQGQERLLLNAKGAPWTKQTWCKNVKRARTALRLADDVKLYGCRHYFATNAIMNGVDLGAPQQLMGHAHIATTQRYIHLAGKNDHLHAAAQKAVNRTGAGRYCPGCGKLLGGDHRFCPGCGRPQGRAGD